jgi:hypothetical protein
MGVKGLVLAGHIDVGGEPAIERLVLAVGDRLRGLLHHSRPVLEGAVDGSASLRPCCHRR